MSTAEMLREIHRVEARRVAVYGCPDGCACHEMRSEVVVDEVTQLLEALRAMSPVRAS